MQTLLFIVRIISSQCQKKKKVLCLFVGLFGCFYGVSIFVGYLMPNPFDAKKIVLFQTIQFSISSQFNCQKYFYFKLCTCEYCPDVIWTTYLFEQATPVDSIKDVVRSSMKVPKFDKHLKKTGGHLGRNIVEITIKMKTIVRKHLMIKIKQFYFKLFRLV